ncbi:hypothetical protein WJX84_004136 [Apatococcus fuscideae]|uniref:Transmembrane protein n=1 Tax=Apatococcus fuscideae TaxID=2026836 RepID=A0AAW1T1S2_9CHLO
MRQGQPKVHYSLLIVAYFEVLLWLTVVIFSCATLSAKAEDTGYLLRETVNLKQTIGTNDSAVSFQGFVLEDPISSLHLQFESLSLQRLAAESVDPGQQKRPDLSLSFLPDFKGVPAPYTGIEAIWNFAGARSGPPYSLDLHFELVDTPKQPVKGPFLRRPFASISDSMLSNKTAAVVPSAPPPPSSPPPPAQPRVDTKPASDVIAGAMARAASQSTIHPLDTLKVRLQASHTATKPALSKIGQLLPPQKIAAAAANPQKVAAATAAAPKALGTALPHIASLYRGVVGAASGAGIAIGAYFAFYGAASNLLARHTEMAPGGVAFVAGGIAAAGGSVVKVPLAVCIRSVQAHSPWVATDRWVFENKRLAAAGDSVVKLGGRHSLYLNISLTPPLPNLFHHHDFF